MRCHTCREPNAGLPSIPRVTTISPRFRYLTLGQAFRLRRSRKFLSRFSQQRLRAWEWDCPLPERSSKPTRVGYGQRTRPGVAQCFTSVCRYQQRNAFETEASESGTKRTCPTTLRDVRFQGQSGKHMLVSSFSDFDPTRTWAL